MKNFFTEHNRFISETGYANDENRLNKRYEAIIQWNKSYIRDKKILDIASHDGRWAFAAIKAGASTVTCVEPRQEHVDWIHENMNHYHVSNYSVIQGDIHEEIERFEANQFDIIFCLGFFYHTLEHGFLLRQFKRLSPSVLVFDTYISRADDETITLKWDHTHNNLAAVSDDPLCLVGFPSKKALESMLKAHGFHFEYFDWGSIENAPEDYLSKGDFPRITIRSVKRRIALN